jgi:hypothetical protein
LSIRTIAQRHPVAGYFIMTFLISWVGSFAAGGPKFVRGEDLELADQMTMLFPMLLGPCIAGIAMTAIVDGRSGLRGLLSRMVAWRLSDAGTQRCSSCASSSWRFFCRCPS